MNKETFSAMKKFPIPSFAVTGGKGGTGKSTVATNLAFSLSKMGKKVILVDMDVDGPNDALLLKAKTYFQDEIDIFKPIINTNKCIKCGTCAALCEERAIVYVKGNFPILFEELCSGCKACYFACPARAIEEGRKNIGRIYMSNLSNLEIITGELKLNEIRTPIVAQKTFEIAYDFINRNNFDVAIVDTAPGVSSTVTRALQGVSFALAVTEPSPLGAYDLERILSLSKKINLPIYVVINRSDMEGGDKEIIYKICDKFNVKVISEIPFDEKLIEAYVKGTPVLDYSPNSKSARAILELSKIIFERIGNS